MRRSGILFCVIGLLASPVVAQTTPSRTASASPAILTPEWAMQQEQAEITAMHAAQQQRRAAMVAGVVRDPFATAPTLAATATNLGAGHSYSIAQGQAFGGDIALQDMRGLTVGSGRGDGLVLSSSRDVWSDGGDHVDRLRVTSRGMLRRADGSPLPPTAHDATEFTADDVDVSYSRGWSAARTRTASGLEVSLTPHAGVGLGGDGTTAEAGATLKIGSDLERLVPDGSREFGQTSRWYVYAAGSGRAVGYNFARNRDGDFARSGVSQDKGSFLGDASVGVAMRRGDMQTSLGVVYREIKAEGMRGGTGIDRDVSEGLLAFQFSIRPR